MPCYKLCYNTLIGVQVVIQVGIATTPTVMLADQGAMTIMTEGLRNDPRTSLDWRTYRTGCPNYRVRWPADSDTRAGEPLYQVYCCLNTPPTSHEEQEQCLHSPTHCWRLVQSKTNQSKRPPQAESSSQPANER